MRRVLALLFAPLILLGPPAKVLSSTLAEIQGRRELVIAVKADSPPFSFVGPDGKPAGIEIELAADLAKRLNVALKILPVLMANRFDLLKEGQADIVIATIAITDQRRKTVALIDPPYYASGAGLLIANELSSEGLKGLSRSKLCGIDGSVFFAGARALAPEVKVHVLKDLPSAEAALLQGECQALVFDDNVLLYRKLSNPEAFKNFKFQRVDDIDPLLWGIAVPLDQDKAELGQAISQAVLDWHRSGFLLEVEKKWLHQNTTLIKALKIKYSNTGVSGLKN